MVHNKDKNSPILYYNDLPNSRKQSAYIEIIEFVKYMDEIYSTKENGEVRN